MKSEIMTTMETMKIKRLAGRKVGFLYKTRLESQQSPFTAFVLHF